MYAGELDCVCFFLSLPSVLQAEIVKRLNAICAQVIPFLSQEVRPNKACHCDLRRRWVIERGKEGGKRTECMKEEKCGVVSQAKEQIRAHTL